MTNEREQSISALLNSVAAKKEELDHRPYTYDGGNQVNPAEISLLKFIAAHPHESVTYIASLMMITKGAVSQTLRKLELKELVEKLQDPLNASRISISLTFKGRVVVKKLQDREKSIDDVLENQYVSLKKKEREIIQNFLIHYNNSLSRRI